MTEPSFEYTHGIGIVRNGDVELKLSRFRTERRDDSVRAQVVASNGVRLFRDNWNLTSDRDTKRLTAALDETLGSEACGRELLHFAAWKAIDAHRAGSPLEWVGRLERRRDRVVLRPLLWQGQPTVVYGPGGTGKSLLAAGIAVQVQTGQDVVPGLRCPVIEETGAPLYGPVLVLDWEGDRDSWNEQIQAVCRGAELPPIEVAYQRMWRPLTEQVEEVAGIVAEYGVLLTIIDSAEAAIAQAENFNGAAQTLFNALRALETTTLILDHVSGENVEKTGAAKPIGGIGKTNRARATWELRAEREPALERIELALIDRKRNGRVRSPSIGLSTELDDIDQDGVARRISWRGSRIEADELQQAGLTKVERLRRLLSGGSLPIPKAAEELGVSESSIRKYLSRYPEFTRTGGSHIGLAIV